MTTDPVSGDIPYARALPPPPPTLIEMLRYLIEEIAGMLIEALPYSSAFSRAEMWGALQAYAVLAVFLVKKPVAVDLSTTASRAR